MHSNLNYFLSKYWLSVVLPLVIQARFLLSHVLSLTHQRLCTHHASGPVPRRSALLRMQEQLPQYQHFVHVKKLWLTESQGLECCDVARACNGFAGLARCLIQSQQPNGFHASICGTCGDGALEEEAEQEGWSIPPPLPPSHLPPRVGVTRHHQTRSWQPRISDTRDLEDTTVSGSPAHLRRSVCFRGPTSVWEETLRCIVPPTATALSPSRQRVGKPRRGVRSPLYP